MSLFQNSVVNKYLKGLTKAEVDQAWQTFTAHFHNPQIQENIRNSKEEQYQGEFLIDLFVNVLGYVKNPTPNFNLTTELKNVKDAKKADGAILMKEEAIAVIELKGTNTTDLSKVEAQAFGYKNNQPNCTYVVTSNLEKLRFYIDNAVDFEEFNLFQISRKQFDLLWLCLAKDSIFKGIPKKIKEESVSEEEAVTKKLYKDYSSFRKEIFTNIVEQNPDYDKLTLFKKTQKLLDRFLFIFFAEDRNLLPPNSIRKIIEQWTDLKDKYDAYKPLYERFKQYFGYLNTGYKSEEYQIFAYNGGLFELDEILDNIQIDDLLLYQYTQKLSFYDYETEVDVNILGHIFEHSLNEIEEIQAELEGQAIDKSKTKRKKDGVFYTPKYITKYIVDNTVGKLCEEKKTELEIIEGEYEKDRKGRKKAILKALNEKLEKYREWLLQITICDPACGSGAFLNQALDFLIKEHRYIDELQTKLLGGGMVFPNVENAILENNLYGVDINEESVEIAKLSLWLRTAQKGRQLTSLNDNIKCGNSLIDDPEVAGEKAFKWEQEFPDVFAKDGFDVVIGNPPYVKLEVIKDISKLLEKHDFITFDRRGDLYVLFVEKGFDLLKNEGFISYIMPNKWLQAGYGEPLRAYLLTKQLQQLIDFGDIQIFQGATTYPIIFTAKNAQPKEQFRVAVLNASNASDFHTNVILSTELFDTNSFTKNTWVISSKKDNILLERLSHQFISLNKFVFGKAYYGIKTGLTKAFLITEEVKNQIIQQDVESSDYIFPFLQGRDIKPFLKPEPISHLLLFEKGFTKNEVGEISEQEAWHWLQNNYPSISEWLVQFESKGKKRTDKGDYWWELRACDYYNAFKSPKIMYQVLQVKPCFIYDEQGLYCNNSMWIIPTKEKGLVGVLNSKMGWWLINKYCTQIQNGCQLIWKYFGQIPIPPLNSKLDEIVSLMIYLSTSVEKNKSSLINFLSAKFQIEKPSKKLQNWYELSFSDFLKELKKQKIKLSLSEEAEWMEYFEAEKAKVQAIQAEIDQTDREIDQMVYELYGLTEEEIAIVENA